MSTAYKSSVIDLPRRKEEMDLFGIQKYQDALVEFIQHSETPITIALQGEWGSGKTSLMNMIEDELCHKGEFYRVWINSWQYSLMKSPEETILKILEGMIEQILSISEENEGKSEAVKKLKATFRKLAVGGGKFLAKQVVDKIGGNAEIVDDFFGGTNSEGAEISQLKKEIQKLIIEIVSDTKNPNTGFVFFIDDLDRIDPPVAVQILELLKNIFDLDKCVFVLAIDYDVVVKGLEPKFGKLTDKNEREFRSFFDKIIQMPFSMPVSSYTIEKFLLDALKRIGFVSENEGNDAVFSELLTDFAILSVGQNPRALKRLTNTISLINLINNKEKKDSNELSNEKLIGFAMVCMQISYPMIYNKLLEDSNFAEWNEQTAIKLKLDKLTEEQLDRLNNTDEFDEDWEKILFRMCQKETYCSNRVFNISQLLNKVKALIPKGQDLGQTIESILEQSAVTNLIPFDKQKIVKGNRTIFNTIESKKEDLLNTASKEGIAIWYQFWNYFENNIENTKGVIVYSENSTTFKIKGGDNIIFCKNPGKVNPGMRMWINWGEKTQGDITEIMKDLNISENEFIISFPNDIHIELSINLYKAIGSEKYLAFLLKIAEKLFLNINK
jgi:hypothetical protein